MAIMMIGYEAWYQNMMSKCFDRKAVCYPVSKRRCIMKAAYAVIRRMRDNGGVYLFGSRVLPGIGESGYNTVTGKYNYGRIELRHWMFAVPKTSKEIEDAVRDITKDYMVYGYVKDNTMDRAIDIVHKNNGVTIIGV